MEKTISDNSYVDLFVATAWSIYYQFKDRDFKGKTVSEIAELIKGDIGDIIEQNGYKVPYFTDMVLELKSTRLQTESFDDCKEKNVFVNKYSVLLKSRLQKD